MNLIVWHALCDSYNQQQLTGITGHGSLLNKTF